MSDDAVLVLGAAAIIGAFNVVLVAALGIVGYLRERAGHADLASLLEAVAKNPLTYIAAFVVIKLG